MISLEEIQKLADLARLSITDEEKTSFQRDIDGILSYVGEVKELGVGEEKTELKIKNVMRVDDNLNIPGSYSEKLIQASPRNEGGYVKVKKIL